MRTDNLSASDDATLTVCENFGGAAGDAAEICKKLDTELTEALAKIETLETQISEQ